MPNFHNKPHQKLSLIICDLLFVICYLLLASSPTFADNLRSSNFKIDIGTINIGGSLSSDDRPKLGSSTDQTTRGQFDSTGFRVRSGFQYLHSTTPFSFSIDKPNLNFNQLLPNTFYTDSNLLSVTTGGTLGYNIMVIENQPLTEKGGTKTIPDATCDPVAICTVSTPAPWTSTFTYGFGYNLSGDGVDTSAFVDSTYFQPLPTNSLGGNPQTVMSHSGAIGTTNATITYQVNLSPDQPTGPYRNVIQYLAIPAF